MKNSLRPGLSLMNRLNYIQKFVVTGFFLLVPAMILLGSYLIQASSLIQTTVNERDALPYYQSILKLTQDVQRHRGMSGPKLLADVSFNDQLTANEASIAADITNLNQVDSQLATRYDLNGVWSPIRDSLTKLLSNYPTLNTSDNFDAHTAVISNLLDMLVQVASTSGLILDPNLDSYYLVTLTTNNFPQLVENMGQLRGYGTLAIANKSASTSDLFHMTNAYDLIQANLRSVRTSFNYVFKGNPSLAQVMGTQVTDTLKTVQAAVSDIQTNFLNTPLSAQAYITKIKALDFYSQSTQTIDAIFNLLNESLDELGSVLQSDIDSAVTQRTIVLAMTLVALLIAQYLIQAFYQSVRQTVKALEQSAQQLAAGKLPGSVVLESRDELAQIATSFNTVASALVTTNQNLIERSHELEIANAMAREANRVKSHFLSTMSHELRTPLNAIVGFTDLLLTKKPGPLTETQQMFLERAAGNNRRLLALINDILDLSRIEAGRVEVQLKAYAPREMLNRIVGQTSSLFSNKGLTFEMTVAPDLPEAVVGDQARVEQVLVNVLSNASKFTSSGGVQLNAQAVDAEYWAITVTDTGRGIPPHLQEVIFEPFRQVDSGSTREVGGSGLGLAISRELVLIMQGTLTVKSVVNQGSTFTITLPVGNLSALTAEPQNVYARAAIAIAN